jgi:signal recognition particle subunit SRP54
MFESLSVKLDKAFQTLKGQGRITEINVAATIKEIRKALIEIKTKAMGQDVLTAISPGQLLIKITNDELTQLMGGQSEDIKIEGNPAVILIAGLQGSGKTTFSGKLAAYLKKQGRSVLLTACDIYRPAAIKQLQVLGEQVGVEVYAEPENKDAVKIAKAAIEHAKANNHRIADDG